MIVDNHSLIQEDLRKMTSGRPEVIQEDLEAVPTHKVTCNNHMMKRDQFVVIRDNLVVIPQKQHVDAGIGAEEMSLVRVKKHVNKTVMIRNHLHQRVGVPGDRERRRLHRYLKMLVLFKLLVVKSHERYQLQVEGRDLILHTHSIPRTPEQGHYQRMIPIGAPGLASMITKDHQKAATSGKRTGTAEVCLPRTLSGRVSLRSLQGGLLDSLKGDRLQQQSRRVTRLFNLGESQGTTLQLLKSLSRCRRFNRPIPSSVRWSQLLWRALNRNINKQAEVQGIVQLGAGVNVAM